MKRLGFCAALVLCLGALLLARIPPANGPGPARARLTTAHPARPAVAPAQSRCASLGPGECPARRLQRLLLRVPRHRQAQGGPEHRAAGGPAVGNFRRRELERLGAHRRHGRVGQDAAEGSDALPHRQRARGRDDLDPIVAQGVRRRARRRSRARDGPPPDQRRVRLRHSRSDRHRHQGRHRRLERLGRRRRLRQLRRRAVRAGRERRALSRSGQAGRRSRGHRRRSARLLHRSRQDRPRAVGAQSHRRALRRQGLPRRLGRRRPAVRPRALRQGVLRRRGTSSTASRSAIRRRRCAALAAKEGITGRFAEHIWARGQQAEHRLSDARRRSSAG